MTNLTLALWQAPYAADSAQSLALLDRTAAKAKAQGAHLLLCPEMGLTGYAIGAERVRALAEPRNGPIAHAVAAIALRHQIAIVYGYPEQHPDGQQPFNAAQCIDHQGLPIGHYRKTHLFGDMDHQQFTAGDAPSQMFEYLGWRLGLLICYDVEFPETVRLLALQGADAVLVPTANMIGFDEVPQLLVPARACENRLFVAYANACGEEGATRYGGLSTVASALGEVIMVAKRGESLQLAQLQRAQLTTARQQGYLAQRRADLYAALSAAQK